jgi:hypothetical protein
MVGGDDMQRSRLQAGPQARLMVFRPKRRRHHAPRRVIPILVEILAVVEHEMLDQRFAEDALAGSARPRDGVMGVAAGGMDDVERTAGHVRDHDRPVGRLALDGGRPRIGVSFGSGHAGLPR